MKRKLIRSSLFSLMFVLLFAACAYSASAAEYVTQGDFTFYVSGDYAAVTKYSGSAENVTVPTRVGSAYVVQIAEKAFWAKKEMKSISLPANIQKIGKAAFNECTGLTKINLPSRIKTIEDSAFWYCTNLQAIYLPASLTSIAANAFTGCSKLTGYVTPSSYAEKYVKASSTVKLGYRFASSLKLPAASAKIAYGKDTQLNYAIYPANTYSKYVTFTSSDTSVLRVSSTGLIRPVSCGSAYVTVRTADGSGVSARILLHVVPGVIPTPVLSAVTATGYTVSWAKSPGATAYGVYRYNESSKNWDLIKKTAGLSYSASGLQTGAYHYYRILPYTIVNSTYYLSVATDYVRAYVLSPGKVSDISTSSTDTEIHLSWKAAANATGYQVYRQDTETGAFVYLGKTENTFAKIKNLKPNTKYVFAIRAYLLYQGSTIVSKEYVNNIIAFTTPAQVSSFRIDPDSVTTSSARLTWDILTGVSGYELYLYDAAAEYKYTLIARLPHEGITGFTVSSLEPGEIRQYCIRAYINTDKMAYGPISQLLSVTPATLPESREEAFNGFVSALNASKFSSDNFYLIKTSEVSNLSGSYIDECSEILDSIAHTSVSKYYFRNGIEKNTALPIGSFIQPYNAATVLALKDVKSCEYTADGSGYSINIVLGEEQLPAAVNSQISPIIDWGVVGGQHKGFAIRYCLYEGTTINAKVQNGRIDDMSITMPINYAFNYGGKDYTFAETITHNYIFGW